MILVVINCEVPDIAIINSLQNLGPYISMKFLVFFVLFRLKFYDRSNSLRNLRI